MFAYRRKLTGRWNYRPPRVIPEFPMSMGRTGIAGTTSEPVFFTGVIDAHAGNAYTVAFTADDVRAILQVWKRAPSFAALLKGD